PGPETPGDTAYGAEPHGPTSTRSTDRRGGPPPRRRATVHNSTTTNTPHGAPSPGSIEGTTRRPERLPAESRLVTRKRRHGPFQEQHPRHRVQPLRGPQGPGADVPGRVGRPRRGHRAHDDLRGRQAGRGAAG